MSSPFRRSDYSRSSPSRSRANGSHISQKDGSLESPELYEEFARLVVDSDREFKKKLDQQNLEQQKKHVEALELALAKHNAVRKSAEETAERIRLEIEAERIREERVQYERQEAARKKVAEEQRKKEEAAQQAATRRRLEEEQRIAAQKKREEDERARQKAAQDKAEAERRAQEKAAADKAAVAEAAKQKQAQSASQTNRISTAVRQAPQQPQPSVQTSTSNLPSGIASSSEECQTRYSQYLEIHGRLRQLREQLPARAKQDPRLRNLSDWRRELTKLLGQINVSDKAANREIIKNVRAVLDNCAQFPEYVTDISQYFLPSRSNGQPIQGSVLLVFLFHYLVKSAIKSMEANLEPLPPGEIGAAADNFGIVLATIFCDPKYSMNGLSFADILWSKYYQQCPVLFGVRKPSKRPNRCLAAGFAALTLRDFSKNRNPNPFPSRHFWEAIARIVNTPPASQTVIHYDILEMVFQPQFASRFIQFYGKAGLVAMRNAIVRFPTTAPASNQRLQSQAKVVTNLTIPLDRDLHLRLS